MKISECQNFNPEYPEIFAWGSIDNITGSNLGCDIVNHINHDLRSTDRNYVPGLRLALNLLAQYVSV